MHATKEKKDMEKRAPVRGDNDPQIVYVPDARPDSATGDARPKV